MTLTTRNDKINKLADRIEHCENIDLFKEELPPEYYYSCIPLCLLDAVYSIGVRYSSTRNVVKRYCDYYNLDEYRDPNTKVNSPEDQHHTIKNLIDNISCVGPDEFAVSIVKNRQRTSSRNGILKSEAVLLCAVKLEEEGVQTISDFNRAMNDSEIAERIEGDIRQIKGQTSGLSFSYLKMLCGDEDQIKPDRHILRFLSCELGYRITVEEAEDFLSGVVDKLKQKYPNLKARQLDYKIWEAMRSR